MSKKKNRNKQKNANASLNVKNAKNTKKKRVALARIKLLTFISVIGIVVFGIYKYSTTAERPPLSIDVSGYVCDAEQLDTDEAAVNENGVIEEELIEDEEAISVFQPTLQDQYPVDMEIYSPRALVFDATDNTLIFVKNADEKCYPASTTKILTAAIVLDSVPADFEFKAGDELDFVNPGSSLAFINKGSRLNTEMIIDALMLPSGNDASYVAAANVGRVLAGNDELSPREAVDAFIDKMNKTAEVVGAVNTHFADPDGFHDDNHYTTLLDMLKITLYAKEFPGLMESVKKPDRYCVFLSGEEVSWENSNKLIHDYSDCYYMYATGMKTGMTDESGYCVIATAERFGHEIICMVFGSSASDIRWNDTIALLDKSFSYIKNNSDVNE